LLKRRASRRDLRMLRLPSGFTTLAKARARARIKTVGRTVTLAAKASQRAEAQRRFLHPPVIEPAPVLRGSRIVRRERRCEPLWVLVEILEMHRVEILEEIPHMIVDATPATKAEAATTAAADLATAAEATTHPETQAEMIEAAKAAAKATATEVIAEKE